ncbi:MAG: hypothetical protein KDA51_18745, partial [Planctomycetales bacterium]|nr:hypothetical protein [Planctomycetales bacterium]
QTVASASWQPFFLEVLADTSRCRPPTSLRVIVVVTVVGLDGKVSLRSAEIPDDNAVGAN